MRPTGKTRRGRGAAALVTACAVAGFLPGCGEEDFENKPRPPVPRELTGVIQEDGVTISPDRIGGGPILITISNQTKVAHSISICETDCRIEKPLASVPPINPLDTATIQQTLRPGTYQVSAGSEVAQPRIQPATLTIGRNRPDSNDELLLP